MTEHLSVCFIWHMHQPLYKDRLSGTYLMPWVRLHAVKDYLDMPLILRDYPRIRQTFNMVPSLMEQLEDYAHYGAVDEQLLLTIRPEDEYTNRDKLYILSESFHANPEHQIKPHNRYHELYSKRQKLLKREHSLEAIVPEFSDREYGDMCAWFNLTWFDPFWHSRIEGLEALLVRGKDFDVEDRKRIIDMQREIIREILPSMKELQAQKQIEITTSPYYHPILPLLIDSNSARLADPSVSLPGRNYLHKEDAQTQIQNGIAYYERTFGTRPKGMWPSELSISPAALDLIGANGINWVVVDEALLAKTLDQPIHRDEHGNLNGAEMICQPYKLVIGDQDITVLFREVVLSNEISFSYGPRPPQDAASALYMRLKHIQQRLFNWHREGVVVIALDGENCWEAYENDGNSFLNELYRRLSEDNTLNVCTVSDYLERNPPTRELTRIQTGSWINSDFHIWIGDPIKNKAWDLLERTRRFLTDELRQSTPGPEPAARAWEEIYAAEGSDWFWWFGDPNHSQHDHVFDQQFRIRLQNVYKYLDKPYPDDLDVPVQDLVARQGQHSQKANAV